MLAAILYLGLDGGAVGSWLAGVLTDVVGNAAYVLPLALVALGGLLLARSELLEVRPFRLGVGVSFLGLMTLLGKDSGGWVGMAIGGTLAALIGTTGAAIIGGALLVGGLLLVTGASTGAILRRTGHVVKRAGSGAKRAFEWPSSESQTAEDVEDARAGPGRRAAPPARRGRGVSRRGRTDDSLGGELARSRGARAGARERRVGVRDVVRAHGVPTAGSRPAPHVAGGRHHEVATRARRPQTSSCARSRSSVSRRPSWARSPARA